MNDVMKSKIVPCHGKGLWQFTGKQCVVSDETNWEEQDGEGRNCSVL